MKFSSKAEKCGLSPMRKFHPYAVAAREKGRSIYHLNIGQPDIETPKAYFDAEILICLLTYTCYTAVKIILNSVNRNNYTNQ